MAASRWKAVVIILFLGCITYVLPDEAIGNSSTLETPGLDIILPDGLSYTPDEETAIDDNGVETNAVTSADDLIEQAATNATQIPPHLISCLAPTYSDILCVLCSKTSSATHVPLTLKEKTTIYCAPRNLTANETVQVQIVNSTTLLAKLGNRNDSQNVCALVMFYAPWCMFCSRTAPHYNAVARAFPQLEVLAIDAVHFSSLNTRFGTTAVPNILIFHNSKAVARFNSSERNLGTIRDFVANITRLKPNITVEVTSADYQGPLASAPTTERDYLLWLAWLFTIVVCCTAFLKSSLGQGLCNFLVNFGVEHQQHID